MAMTFKVSVDDPQVEEILLFIEDKFPGLDNYDTKEILKRCLRWMDICNESIFDEDYKRNVHLKVGFPLESVREDEDLDKVA